MTRVIEEGERKREREQRQTFVANDYHAKKGVKNKGEEGESEARCPPIMPAVLMKLPSPSGLTAGTGEQSKVGTAAEAVVIYL